MGNSAMKIERLGKGREFNFLNLRSIFFGILTAFALALLTGSSSQAQTILGPTVSLASLTNGSGILVGDKFFDEFTIGSTYYTATNVLVTGIEAGSDYGIRFSGNFFALNNNSSDLTLGYRVGVVTT